jgi:cytochrome c oxidase assembly protein subunit 15
MDIISENPITAFDVILQMVHRICALAIFIFVATTAIFALLKLGWRDSLTKFSLFWLALILVQIGLGAWTVLSNKAADVATTHLLVGALALVTGALGCIISFRRSSKIAATQNETFGAFGNLAANK